MFEGLAMRNSIFTCLLALFAIFAAPARAEVVVGFHNYELSVGLNTRFPHTLVSLKGTTSEGTVVDDNIGFTAKSITPAVLTGWVKGLVEKQPQKYIDASERQFEVKITDAQYKAILALAEEWRNLPGKSYHLSKRNCIHFVANVGALLGLKSDVGKAYVKKPRAFLVKMLELNTQLVALSPAKNAKAAFPGGK